MLEIRKNQKLNLYKTFEVTNTIKKYKIITNVVERNGVKGGTISGGNEAVCEYVRYDEGNVNDIVITPDEGYKIVNLTIDGNEIQVIPNSDDTYVLPVGYFNNVKKDNYVCAVDISDEEFDLECPRCGFRWNDE